MQTEFQVLMAAAISIACLHTLSGPDHYVPFIALSRSRNWSLARTIGWTVLCGCAHVWSSVLLGLGGAAAGWSLSRIEWLEGVRGGIAGWMLLGFGIVYGIWGLWKMRRGYSHKHFDTGANGDLYVYEHNHNQAVAPGAVAPGERHKVTPWVMFIIFLLGPCEPMIPLLYFPAAKSSWTTMVTMIAVYTVFTLAMMLIMVLPGFFGVSIFRISSLEKYMHALGGLTITICGAGMVFLDW